MNINNDDNIYKTDATHYLMNTYARYPLTLVKGEGAFLWDIHGKKYLDFISGIGCTSLGHCHPAIENAVLTQIKKVLHTSNLYYSPPNIELAKWLVKHGGLDKIYFCNSGAEANETAIKLARKYQWRHGRTRQYTILSATNSFHGRTLGALAATARPHLQEGFGPMPPGFHYQSCQDEQAFYRAINDEVAAVILEPIQGEGGIHVASTNFLRNVRELCDQYNAVLIFDEVQCGIGRTGELFAYQTCNVVPDIITLAKGIANGLPLGAVCAKQDVAHAFMPKDHGSTFGGNPICCAAALANLTTLLEQNYLARIKQLSAYLILKLKALQSQYPALIKEIRGTGLMLGIELISGADNAIRHCQQEGLLVNMTAENTLRLLPPYVINENDIDFALNIMSNAMKMIYFRDTP